MALEVLKFRDIVRVTSIPRVIQEDGVNPSLEMVGEDFSSVEQVFFNDVASPGFIILSKHKMIAELPAGVRRNIRTVEVLSSLFTGTAEASKVLFEMGDRTCNITGLLRLMQLYVMWLLKTPGSDIFRPDDGGGLLRMAGQLATGRSMSPLLSGVTQAVERTTDQIRNMQSNVRSLPASERLLDASCLGVDANAQDTSVSASIIIDNVLGEQATSLIDL